MLTTNQTIRHLNNPWLHSHCGSPTNSMTFTDKQDLHHLPTWLRPSRPLPTSRSRTRNGQPVSGGQLVLVFCFVLLYQACVSSAEEDGNGAASPVNTHHRQHFSLLKARRNPKQIEYIVRQWHSFRKTRRQNHRNQRKKAVVKEETLQRRLSRRQARNRADRFNKVVLGREARALQRASSFDEFKRILFRSSLKSLDAPRVLNESILDASILPEVSGGVVFHSQPHSKTKKALSIMNKNRTISKRSLDSNDENLFGEQEAEDYSEEELRFAYESYNEFLTKACKPVNKTLCTKTFFPNMHKSKSTLFLPPGLYVQRCDNPIWSTVYGFGSSLNSYQVMFDQASRMRSKSALKALCDAADRMNPNVDTRSIYAADAGGSCTCGLPEEECLPTEVRLKTAPVVVYNTAEGTTATEVIALTEHMACQCKRRCDNRQCVPPLKLSKYTYDDCYCYCEKGDSRCEALLEGKVQFTEKELPMPLNGSYIMPPCYHGQMDEVHLYFRHCPRADGRIGDF
nr:hypothetical transcript [Hymenolepis microstoma]